MRVKHDEESPYGIFYEEMKKGPKFGPKTYDIPFCVKPSWQTQM